MPLAEFFRLTTLGQLSDEEADAADDFAPQPSAADGDTIAAIVTGAQQGAVSIIRLSGDDAVPIAQRVFSPAGQPAKQQAAAARWEPESHRVYYGQAVDAAGGVLDEVRPRESHGDCATPITSLQLVPPRSGCCLPCCPVLTLPCNCTCRCCCWPRCPVLTLPPNAHQCPCRCCCWPCWSPAAIQRRT